MLILLRKNQKEKNRVSERKGNSMEKKDYQIESLKKKIYVNEPKQEDKFKGILDNDKFLKFLFNSCKAE